MTLVIIWLMCAVLAAMIAHSRGGSAFGGFVLGFVLGPFGVVGAFFLGSPRELEARTIRSGQMRRCPQCAELVRTDARICKHCRTELVVLQQTSAQALPSDSPPSIRASWSRRNLVVAGVAVFAIWAAGATISRSRHEPVRPGPAAEQCAAAETQIMRARAGSGGVTTNPLPGVLETTPAKWSSIGALEKGSLLASLSIQSACSRKIRASEVTPIVREIGSGRSLLDDQR